MSDTFDLDKWIRRVPDFPKPGVLFYDITGVLADPDAFGYCVNSMVDMYREKEIDAVAAIEARGFLFAAPFAERLRIPLIPIRKKGKLPGKKLVKEYSLEYAQAAIEVHIADVKPGSRILLTDDLIATGGTLKASIELLEQCGATVPHIFGVVGLPFLNYEEALKPIPVNTLINYYSE
jgi:adenine phosphoribosyltransferase